MGPQYYDYKELNFTDNLKELVVVLSPVEPPNEDAANYSLNSCLVRPEQRTQLLHV